MRHVDEGWLHAYIDGAFESGTAERADIEAHLAACADCRVRLDDARRIRDVSQEALDAAAPSDSPAPAWETIVAEHARRTAGGTAGSAATRRPRIPLAWAASLVLAVGAGWMARAMLAERAPAMESQVGSSVSSPAEPLEQSAESELPRIVAAPPPAPAEPARQDATAPPARRMADADAAARQRSVDAAGGARNEAVTAPQAKAAASPSMANSAAGRALAADEVALERFAPSAPLAVAADSAAGRWMTVALEDVVAAFGTEPVRVDGMTPDTVQLATVDGVSVARGVYLLPTGAVEVLQRPAVSSLNDELRESREAEVDVRSARAVLRGIEVLVRGPSPLAVQEVRDRLR